jgi:hypothetical protein
MKMVFYPMLLLSIYLVVSQRDIREVGAPILGGLAMMPLIVASFFAYWVFVRHELLMLDVVIYLGSMVGAVLLARRWRNSQFVQKSWPLWLALIVVCIVLTGVLTYHAPDWIVFADLGECWTRKTASDLGQIHIRVTSELHLWRTYDKKNNFFCYRGVGIFPVCCERFFLEIIDIFS